MDDLDPVNDIDTGESTYLGSASEASGSTADDLAKGLLPEEDIEHPAELGSTEGYLNTNDGTVDVISEDE